MKTRTARILDLMGIRKADAAAPMTEEQLRAAATEAKAKNAAYAGSIEEYRRTRRELEERGLGDRDALERTEPMRDALQREAHKAIGRRSIEAYRERLAHEQLRLEEALAVVVRRRLRASATPQVILAAEAAVHTRADNVKAAEVVRDEAHRKLYELRSASKGAIPSSAVEKVADAHARRATENGLQAAEDDLGAAIEELRSAQRQLSDACGARASVARADGVQALTELLARAGDVWQSLVQVGEQLTEALAGLHDAGCQGLPGLIPPSMRAQVRDEWLAAAQRELDAFRSRADDDGPAAA